MHVCVMQQRSLETDVVQRGKYKPLVIKLVQGRVFSCCMLGKKKKKSIAAAL